MNIPNLILNFEQVFRQFGHIPQLLLPQLHLPIKLLNLNPNHPNIILQIPHGHLTLPQNILLNITLLIQNTQLIIPINKLYPRIVAVLTSVLVLLAKGLHVFLQGEDYHVELLDLVDVLVHELFLLALLQLVLV